MCAMREHTPQASELADQLQRLAYYGVGRAMGDLTAADIPQLAAVSNRLTPDPRGRLRVTIALAVERAVDMIDPPRHAEAARRLLWLTDKEELEDDKSRKRKPLSDRYPEVAALLGHALTTYERYKKWQSLYHQIALNLVRLLEQQDITPPPDQGNSNGTQLFVDEPSELVSSAAAGLHFAALTSLFIACFHNQYIDDPWVRTKRIHPWDDAASNLFDSYTRLEVTIGRCIDIIHSKARSGVTQAIDADNIFRLFELLDLITQCSPLDEAAVGAVMGYGMRLTDMESRDRSTPVADNLSNQTPEDVYKTMWLSWHRLQFDKNDRHTLRPPDPTRPVSCINPESISVMAMLAAQIVITVTDHTYNNRPVVTSARGRALRLISTFYDFDDWQPLNGGGSLRDTANSFFDLTGHRLVQQLPTSYSDTDGWCKIHETCIEIKRERLKDYRTHL